VAGSVPVTIVSTSQLPHLKAHKPLAPSASWERLGDGRKCLVATVFAAGGCADAPSASVAGQAYLRSNCFNAVAMISSDPLQTISRHREPEPSPEQLITGYILSCPPEDPPNQSRPVGDATHSGADAKNAT
jgi:hypothetical protein